MISTKYYLIEFSKDVVGVEINSAIKNIYSMIIGSGQSLNRSSSLFQKSILEMKYITKYFKGKEETVLSLFYKRPFASNHQLVQLQFLTLF
ncbi:hypothetical protein IDG52_03385 [Pelagibacterales bacterium SAG-MED23]|nr:hypothetical protein [Pelagibacterales bacterium SAG-MED23]